EGRRRWRAGEAEPGADQAAAGRILALAHHHAVLPGAQLNDVAWALRGDTQTFTLADSEVVDALVRPQHRAGPIHDLAGPIDSTGILPQEALIVPSRHEADLLAVRLLRYRQLQLTRYRPGVVLGQRAKRKQHAAQVVLPQRVEHI